MKHEKSSRAIANSAPLIALASAALFGLSTPVAKVLLGDVSPWVLASLLYLGSGVGLTVARLLMRSRTSEEAPLARHDLPWLFGTVIFGGVFGPIFLLLGLSHTDAASASLLLNLEAVFTMGMAWFVFKEHVDVRLLAGAVAIVAGATLLSWQGGISGPNTAMLYIAIACLSWAIDNNLTRKISAVDPILLTSIKGLCAGVVNAGLAYVAASSMPSSVPLISGMALGFVSYGVGLVFFIVALRHLGTARTGAYYGTAPFIGALLSVVIFQDPITPTLLLAGVLMAIGAWLHLAERHSHDHTHDELDHTHRHTHDEHHEHTHGPDDPVGEPHSHPHHHARLVHAHAHWPDLHHRHAHHHQTHE